MSLAEIPPRFGKTFYLCLDSLKKKKNGQYTVKYSSSENISYNKEGMLAIGVFRVKFNLGSGEDMDPEISYDSSDINYKECHGYKCRRDVEKSINKWCVSCHDYFNPKSSEDIGLLLYKVISDIHDVKCPIVKNQFKVTKQDTVKILEFAKKMGKHNPYPSETKKLKSLYKRETIMKTISPVVVVNTPHGTIDVNLTKDQIYSLFKEKKMSIRRAKIRRFKFLTSEGKFYIKVDGNKYKVLKKGPSDLTGIQGNLSQMKRFKIENISIRKTKHGLFLILWQPRLFMNPEFHLILKDKIIKTH